MSAAKMTVKRRKWLSPNKRRWANLLSDIRPYSGRCTQAEVEAWLDSIWLLRVTSRRTAELARIALRNDGTYLELAEEYDGSASQFGSSVRSVISALQQLYEEIAAGNVKVVAPGEAHPTMDAKVSTALIAGMAKPAYFRGVPQFYGITFKQLPTYCSAEHGLRSSTLTLALSDNSVARICDLCAEVHRLNGTQCPHVCCVKGKEVPPTFTAVS